MLGGWLSGPRSTGMLQQHATLQRADTRGSEPEGAAKATAARLLGFSDTIEGLWMWCAG